VAYGVRSAFRRSRSERNGIDAAPPTAEPVAARSLHDPLTPDEVLALERLDPACEREVERQFRAEAQRVQELHRRQTFESIAGLKTKYEHPAFGRVRVWDLIEKLALCVDPTDLRLFCASQWMHVRQTIATMEQEGVEDPDLFLIALLHDLAKVFLLTGEVPENLVCGSNRVGTYPPGIGLDQMVFQFGHGELMYSRIKDHVPEHVAWTVRYHSIDVVDTREFMNERDLDYSSKYLYIFRRCDGRSKSPMWSPDVDMAKYRELIERYFPQPILF
jgi:hypothetical protein